MGRAVAGPRSTYLSPERRDLREPEWWRAHRDSFDLVVSATALHWLTPGDYLAVCGRVRSVLRPGGWFLNSDHVAAVLPEVRARCAKALEEARDAAFARSGALRWDAYWAAFGEHLRTCGYAAETPDGQFEGDDDGYPLAFHQEALSEAVFDGVAVVWREFGEAVLAARRPPA